MPPRRFFIAPALPAAHRLVLLSLTALLTATGCPSRTDPVAAPNSSGSGPRRAESADRPGLAVRTERPAARAAPAPDESATPSANTATTTDAGPADATAATPADPATATTTHPPAHPSIDSNGQPGAVTPDDDPYAGVEPPIADTSPGDSPPGDPPGDPPDDSQAPPAPTAIDPAICRAACDNALSVTLTELPETTAASMREELKRVLETECPSRCLAKASVESAHCIATARSALALASCP